MSTSRHAPAIRKAHRALEEAEHNLLVLIALGRAEDGRHDRFPFNFHTGGEKWFKAHIREVEHAHPNLVITWARSGDEYYATPLPLAQARRN